MALDSEFLLERLTALTAAEPASRWLVAFSGGIDSTVLLHALSGIRDQQQNEIIAIHVDHGLHPDSSKWEVHCRQFAEGLDVAYVSKQVRVSDEYRNGPEAAARQARLAPKWRGLVSSSTIEPSVKRMLSWKTEMPKP